MSYRIYLIIHNVSGRVYVGQTRYSVQKRVQKHYTDSRRSRTHFQKALQHYGGAAFSCFELASGLSKVAADELERVLIAQHRATEPAWGFNHTRGGEGSYVNACKHGHRTTEPGDRNPSGACRECDRLRARTRKKGLPLRLVKDYCTRGHDRRLPGALTPTGACKACETQRNRSMYARRRGPQPFCGRGHEIAVVGRDRSGDCIECRRARYAEKRAA